MPKHSRSVGSAGLGLGAFALSFLGVPRWLAWILLAAAAFLVIAAGLFWIGEQGRLGSKQHEGTSRQDEDESASPTDPLVQVAYGDQTGNDLVVRFDFPRAPVNKLGKIELVPGHGTRVDWVIELTNMKEGAKKAHITLLAPSHLIHHIDPISPFSRTKTDFTAENMVSDGTDSLRFRGWFSPLMGGGRTTELEFQTTISYAYRDIPVRVQVDDEDGSQGLADVYLPIRAVIAPDSKPVRGR